MDLEARGNGKGDGRMKTGRWMVAALLAVGLCGTGTAQAGDLNPPGAPEATMRTLQEIYDKLLEIEAKIDAIAEVPDDPDPVLLIMFDFEDGDRQAKVGDSEISREPGFEDSYSHTSHNKTLYTNGWDDGVGTKYWIISFSTVGFENILLNSAQFGSDTGPRDFKIQYSVGEDDWIDVHGGTLELTGTNPGDATVVANLPLPSACDDQELVSVRWVVTSTVSINDGTVSSAGNSRIFDLSVSGSAL